MTRRAKQWIFLIAVGLMVAFYVLLGRGDGAEYYQRGFDSYNRQDFSGAVHWFRKAASRNNIEALYALGFCYERGLGVTQDYAKAQKLYDKANNVR